MSLHQTLRAARFPSTRPAAATPASALPTARALALAASAMACAAAIDARARTDEAPAGEIVVTGTGLATPPATPAYNVQEIDRNRLQQSASGRIEDALSNIAGFQQFRRSDSRAANPSAQGVTLRALGGNATSRSLVLLDGVPMADPFFGYIPLSALSPERLAGVRVTKGGGSGAFGAGAVAGTIELTSAGPRELGLLTAQGLIDDRGDTELSGTLAPRIGKGFAVLGGRWDRGPGFWTTPEAQRGPASVKARYESWSAGLRYVAPLAPDIELQLRGLAFDDSRTLRFAGADTGSSGQDGSVRIVGRGRWQFDALGYVQARDFYNTVISASTFKPTLAQRSTPATGAGGKIELRPPVGGGHVLRLGADWRVAEGHTNEDSYKAGVVNGHRRAGGTNRDFGLFAEDDWSIGPVVLTGGLRADRTAISGGMLQVSTLSGALTTDKAFPAQSGWSASGRGGVVVHALPQLDLRTAGYSNLRQPTLNELYRTFTVFPITTQANPALGNERLVGYEGGLDWRPVAAVTLSLTGFDNRVRHAIANVTIDATTRQRQNVDAIHARGIEASARATWHTLSLGTSVSYTEAKVEAPGQAFDGKRPAQTPRWATSATASWQPAERWTLALTLRHVGLQYEDDLQTDALKAATTLDAFAQVPLKGPVSLVLRGENLFDATIVTRNAGGSMDYGTPRTLWAGLRVAVR